MILNPIERLMYERKVWRKTHPYGFVARPIKNDDGTPNFMIWDCVVPGKEGTLWEHGLARVPLLDITKEWRPDLSIAQILLGIQRFLYEPDPEDPVQMDTLEMFREDRVKYKACIRLQAAIMSHLYS